MQKKRKLNTPGSYTCPSPAHKDPHRPPQTPPDPHRAAGSSWQRPNWTVFRDASRQQSPIRAGGCSEECRTQRQLPIPSWERYHCSTRLLTNNITSSWGRELTDPRREQTPAPPDAMQHICASLYDLCEVRTKKVNDTSWFFELPKIPLSQKNTGGSTPFIALQRRTRYNFSS